ncbi:MAG: hypothetical protein AB7I59_24450 [Geminicoccaceae bacterium]
MTKDGDEGMQASKYVAILLAATVPVSLAAGPAAAAPYDQPVCYKNKDKYDDTTRIVLNVKKFSRLTAGQTVYEADGKHSYKDGNYNRMAVFDGAVVTSLGFFGQPKGAHLGGESYWGRPGGPNQPIAWDCSSEQISSTPYVWYCTITGAANQTYNLVQTDPNKDYLCNVFQDGDSHYVPPPPPPPPPPKY